MAWIGRSTEGNAPWTAFVSGTLGNLNMVAARKHEGTQMKTAKILMWVAVAGLALAQVAQADPVPGHYETNDLGGLVDQGRWSESWQGGGEGALTNTVHAMAYEEVSPGVWAPSGQWEIAGPAINATPQLILGTMPPASSGQDQQIWYTTYGGGTMDLYDGPWYTLGDALPYTCTVTGYSHTTTVNFIDGVEDSRYTTVNLTADFDNYAGYSVDLLVAVAVEEGKGSPLPTGFPGFLPSCETEGAWGRVQEIRMTITPEPATMAFVGLGLAGLVLRRRR